MIHCDIKKDASYLFKCIQDLKIKISRYLEDRLTVNDRMCKPRDSHFRYPDSITIHFIQGLFSFSRGHSNLVKICFVTTCRDLITARIAITSTPELSNFCLLHVIIKSCFDRLLRCLQVTNWKLRLQNILFSNIIAANFRFK